MAWTVTKWIAMKEDKRSNCAQFCSLKTDTGSVYVKMTRKS
jgi:hypothetical protein